MTTFNIVTETARGIKAPRLNAHCAQLYFKEQVQSKEEKKRRRAVLYRSDMRSRSEVRKEKRNWSWSGERKEKSRKRGGAE